jgi:hypothetical protein
MIKGQYWLFLGITAVGLLIGSLGPMAILLGPMMCGIYLALLARYRGEAVTFELLFKGFDYFLQSLVAALIQAVPVIVLLVPVYIVYFVLFMSKMRGHPRGARVDPSEFYSIFILVGVMMLFVFVIIMLIHAFFVFTYPLIVDRRLSAVDALRTSARAVVGNLGGVMGLMALTALLGIVGVLFCYVGAFLVMPVSFAAWAVAYRQVFPAEM